jgi:hypothetical protein
MLKYIAKTAPKIAKNVQKNFFSQNFLKKLSNVS